MSCRFPGGARSLEEYWRVLSTGVDTIREIPVDRFNINDYYDPNPDVAGKMYPRGGAFLEDLDLFDPSFFLDISQRSDCAGSSTTIVT